MNPRRPWDRIGVPEVCVLHVEVCRKCDNRGWYVDHGDGDESKYCRCPASENAKNRVRELYRKLPE